MTGKIKKIKIFIEKGVPPQIVQTAHCMTDWGIKGDRYAKGGEKQLTAIDEECVDWMSNQTQKGLCFDRFKANLEIAEIDMSQLKAGDKLACGDAKLEISQVKKECFDECPLVQSCMECKLRTHAKYLKVVQGAVINAEDEIYAQQQAVFVQYKKHC